MTLYVAIQSFTSFTNFFSNCYNYLCTVDAAPEMLQYGYALIMATLDFLMVAQCASLVHKVVVAGWEVMQFPWVRAVAGAPLTN